MTWIGHATLPVGVKHGKGKNEAGNGEVGVGLIGKGEEEDEKEDAIGDHAVEVPASQRRIDHLALVSFA